MSSSQNPKLPAKAEALLDDWPLKEPDWEAFATRIVERAHATSGTPSESSEELYQAPFPAEPGEEGYVSSTRAVPEPVLAERATDEAPAIEATPTEAKDAEATVAEAEAAEAASKEPASAGSPATEKPGAGAAPFSLADLARASVKKKTDGTKDIALESLMVATQQRANVEELAERVHAVSRAPQPSKPDPAELIPPSGAWVEESQGAPSVPQRPVAPAPQSSRGPWIVSGVAALAAAAALILALRRPEPVAPLSPQVTTTGQAAPGPQAAAPNAPVAPAPAAPAAEVPGAGLEQLPVEQQGKATAPAPVAAKGAPGAPAPATAPSASVSGVKPEEIVLEEEEPAPAPVASTPPAAAPAQSAPLRPAELHSGGLPDKPSSGAVNAAIGSVMGAARACVAGLDEPSTARITFGSDGRVQSVGVSGAAAGTAAAGCIESAFKRARVQPFASPSFTIGATIRPN